MENNPFISRNNDLFIMFFVGAGLYFTSLYVTPIAIQEQFLFCLGFSFLSGLFLNSLFETLEWAFFFLLGLLVVALSPYFLPLLSGQEVALTTLLRSLFDHTEYGCFLLSSWLIGIPGGYGLQKLLMHNYYRQHSLF
ncbi:MAG: hypothetical protein AAF203_08600 [Pseudomonadota bacterium]